MFFLRRILIHNLASQIKKKITVTTGTRAEYGILRPVLKEISSNKKLKLYLIVAGMHLSRKHGLTINEIKKDGFKIQAIINMIPKGNSTYDMAQSLGKGVMDFAKIFHKIKPDINLILGDRDEVLASALAASHMNIPNAHIHGGDKSKAGIDEYNRHAITKLSNIHFAATKKSKERIIQMGENPKYVFLTGSPSIDEIFKNKITNKPTLEKKYGIKITGEEILLLYHPVTTEPELSYRQISNILQALVKIGKTVIAIAPNSDAGNQEIFEELKIFSKKYDFIKLSPNFPRSDFLGMLKNCGVLVGNSSSGIVEASYFEIPVVNVGIRQQGRERGRNVLNVNGKSITRLCTMILMALEKKKMKKLVKDNIYGDGRASKRIVKYLEKITLDKELIQKQIFY